MCHITHAATRLSLAPQPAPACAALATALFLCLGLAPSQAQVALTIDSLSLDTNGTRQIAVSVNVSGDTNYYYCVYRGDTPFTATNPISFTLGDTFFPGGPGAHRILTDASPLTNAAFYRVAFIEKANPLDSDADGMSDIYEITYGLNPLDPADASQDPDHDGFTNLQEFYLGTDPHVPNAFPGGGGLVINEIDYDNVGTDDHEFVEILNTSTNLIFLANKALVLLNGASTPAAEYLRVDLSQAGTVLNPGQYLLVCSPLLTVPDSALRINFSLTANNIQNGAPDGAALVDTIALQVIDALSYEGSITAAQILGFPSALSLVEGTALPASVADRNDLDVSLIRWPNGSDTNDAATDWRLSARPTPGLANVAQ